MQTKLMLGCKARRSAILRFLFGMFLVAGSGAAWAAANFVVMTNAVMPRPKIVIQYNAASNTGWDWTVITNNPPADLFSAEGKMRGAAVYLQDAIKKMTTNQLTIISSTNVSQGIVLTTLAGAGIKIQTNSLVKAALTNFPTDSFNGQEAYYILSETNRLLIVANTVDGLVSAVPALMESVNYEVLGMGPNAIYVEAGHTNNLIFNISTNGRPTFYVRQIAPMGSQELGVGTIWLGNTPQPPAPDEAVEHSYNRWAVGSRLAGISMPRFPGQALTLYQGAALAYIRTNSSATNGFYAKVQRGLNSARPGTPPAGWSLWVNTDTNGAPAFGQAYYSYTNVAPWLLADPADVGLSLDQSVPWVRNIIFTAMKQKSEDSFSNFPSAFYCFGAEPEDGGTESVYPIYAFNKTWYPTYRTAEGQSWGSYALNGFMGLNQPTELWDTNSVTDSIFGYGNWLLREFDKYVNALPVANRKTSAGLWKTNLIRIGLMSYASHDVPPDFNLDGRMHVQIGSFGANRGFGKWQMLVAHNDLALAFKVLLPKSPSSDYRITSGSYTDEHVLAAIVSPMDFSAKALTKDYTNAYTAGIKEMTQEIDFNFGRYGLGYYLMGKLLWNSKLTTAGLDTLRDRWFLRAYGSASTNAVKKYYDFMLTENYPVNTPATWGYAIKKLDDAAVSAPAGGPYEQRFDDLKQYWYFYYLVDTGAAAALNTTFKTFTWKGQMSYMTCMYMVLKQFYAVSTLNEALTTAQMSGAAHYTHAEMNTRWSSVKSRWPVLTPNLWTNFILTNGVAVKTIDHNDMVRIDQFQFESVGIGEPFYYNAGNVKGPLFYMYATNTAQPIGFKMFWWGTGQPGTSFFYGLDWWDRTNQQWVTVADIDYKFKIPVYITNTWLGAPQWLSTIQTNAPHPGTYRFKPGPGQNTASIAGLDFDLVGGTNARHRGLTFIASGIMPDGSSQNRAWFYIPKGVAKVDFDVWDAGNSKQLVLFKGPIGAPTSSRTITNGAFGLHNNVTLQAGEAGNLACFEAGSLQMPFLYSVPSVFAKCPADLMIPRAVATADGLTVYTGAAGGGGGTNVYSFLPTNVVNSTSFNVTWTSPTRASYLNDWVGLALPSDPLNTYSSFVYLSDSGGNYTQTGVTGSQLSAPVAPGTYQLRYFTNNTFGVVFTNNIVVQ